MNTHLFLFLWVVYATCLYMCALDTIDLNKNVLNHLFRPDDQLVREHSRRTVVNPETEHRGVWSEYHHGLLCIVFFQSLFYKP